LIAIAFVSERKHLCMYVYAKVLCAGALVSEGIIFFLVTGAVLCFGFGIKIMLIAY